MKINSILVGTAICAGLLSFVVQPEELVAQQSGYKVPPQAVVDIIDATPEPAVSFSPDREWIMLIDRDAMPDIADVSRRMLQLAGMRIDPAANSSFQTSFMRGLTLHRRDSKPDDQSAMVKIDLPADVKISSVSWSHNSKNFAFVVVTDQGQQLWTATVDNPQAQEIDRRV